MGLQNPNIQIVRYADSNGDLFFICVTSQFDTSDYMYDGYDDTPTLNGTTLEIAVKVKREGTPLRITKTIQHQVPVTGINMSQVQNVTVEVLENTTQIAVKTKPHQDEDETVIRPIGEEWPN